MAASLLAPLAGNPDRSTMRWAAIGACNPDIRVAIPAVVTGNPNVAGMRRRRNSFNRMRRRWPDADDNLSIRAAHSEKKRASYAEQALLHETFSFQR
jgi:hypothetical protein